MKQTKIGSLKEAITNTCIGFFISLLAGYIIFPLCKVELNHSQNVTTTLCFTVISIARSYVIRRFFNAGIRIRIIEIILLYLKRLIYWKK